MDELEREWLQSEGLHVGGPAAPAARHEVPAHAAATASSSGSSSSDSSDSSSSGSDSDADMADGNVAQKAPGLGMEDEEEI